MWGRLCGGDQGAPKMQAWAGPTLRIPARAAEIGPLSLLWGLLLLLLAAAPERPWAT